MTTSAAWIQLPHGWLFRDSQGVVGYQGQDGKIWPLEFAVVNNPVEAVQKACDDLKKQGDKK